MAFDTCKNPPTDKDLAIPALDRATWHMDAINAQHRYWSKHQTSSEESVDLAKHALAQGLHTEFADFNRGVLLNALGASDPWFVERDRRRILGTLALSRLFRTMLRATDTADAAPLLDGRAYKFSNILGDMMADESGMPLDHRLHMMREHVDGTFPPPEDEGATDQWYRHGTLYVRRNMAADPSDPIILWLQEREIEVPFDRMTTLYPYVASVAS